jgi:hypothetical protein
MYVCVSLGDKVDFQGIRLRLSSNGFDEEAFQTIAAGQTVEVSFDAAELHDLAAGGAYDFVANGVLSYAAADSTEIAGVIPYFSNTVTAKVDATQAVESRTAFLNKRTVRNITTPFINPETPSAAMTFGDMVTDCDATNRQSRPTAPVPSSPPPATP